MSNCVMCGVNIPDGQSTCSMCYGDPYHGNDGIYLKWMEDQMRQEEEKFYEQQEYNKLMEDDGEY